MKKIGRLAILFFGFFTLSLSKGFVQPIFAQITNPVLEGSELGSYEAATSGTAFALYFVKIWYNAINIGAILLLLYLIWGGIDWITAGGDSGKISNARNKIVQAVIGMILLAFSFVIIAYISYLFFGVAFDPLNLKFLTPDSNTPTQIKDAANSASKLLNSK